MLSIVFYTYVAQPIIGMHLTQQPGPSYEVNTDPCYMQYSFLVSPFVLPSILFHEKKKKRKASLTHLNDFITYSKFEKL